MLPNSADGVYFNELIDSYAKRCRQSKRGVGRTKSYNLRRLHNYFEHFPAQLTKHQLLEFANIRLASGVKPPTLLMDFNLIRAIAKHAIDYLDLGLDLRPFSAVQATLLADGHIGRPNERGSNERDRRPTHFFCKFLYLSRSSCARIARTTGQHCLPVRFNPFVALFHNAQTLAKVSNLP
jgi:hypothetical protein